MVNDLPYEDIVNDAISGKQVVVVFCDRYEDAERHKKAIAATARRMNARCVVAPRRDRRVDIDNSVVRLVITNGTDGRGVIADVAYLSEKARMQRALATLMGAEIK